MATERSQANLPSPPVGASGQMGPFTGRLRHQSHKSRATCLRAQLGFPSWGTWTLTAMPLHHYRQAEPTVGGAGTEPAPTPRSHVPS